MLYAKISTGQHLTFASLLELDFFLQFPGMLKMPMRPFSVMLAKLGWVFGFLCIGKVSTHQYPCTWLEISFFTLKPWRWLEQWITFQPQQSILRRSSYILIALTPSTSSTLCDAYLSLTLFYSIVLMSFYTTSLMFMCSMSQELKMLLQMQSRTMSFPKQQGWCLVCISHHFNPHTLT